MIKHVVSFKLKGTETERRQCSEKFKRALLNLQGKIECLRSMEVGINCNPEEKWDLVLISTFDNLKDLKEYANNPLHVEAASIIADLKEDRACVDFEI